MADDNNQRGYRTNEPRAPASGSGNDPLAELARLIGQSDPFAEFGRDAGRRAPAPQPDTWPPAPAGTALNSPPTAPASAQPEMPQPRMFGTPNYEAQRFAASPLAGGAGLYRTASEAPPYDDTEQQGGEYASDDYYEHGEHAAEEEDVYDDVPPRRRIGIMAIAGVFALAIIGTAGAFGYRALFGSSSPKMSPPIINADATPNKVVPSMSKDSQSSKQITDRVGTPGQGEKLVPREEQPVDIKDSTVAPPTQLAQQTAPLAPANGSGVVAAEPKKVRTIVIRPDQMADAGAPPPAQAMAPPVQAPAPRVEAPAPVPPPAPKPLAATARPNLPPVVAEANTEPPPAAPARPAPAAPVHRPAAAPGNAPLSLNPGDEAPAPRAAAPQRAATASAPAAARPAPQASSGGGFAVQVSAQRSEAEAQAAFRSMQAKYPTQLGNREPMIKRVDLGDKGIYFRAMVGPFASGNEASEVCNSLKSAGGQCIVQKI